MNGTRRVSKMTSEEIKSEVRKAYSRVAARGRPAASSCCSPEAEAKPEPVIDEPQGCGCSGSQSPAVELAESVGYDLSNLPEAVTESFAGCGNPVALASLMVGEVVLDLGSGAGLDVFVAARKVGPTGHVIGVDMTPAMLDSARRSATDMGITNVEFREGDIENLPIEDNSIDVIISNCVINLAPDKAKVFKEAFRVLKPGGRLMVSDIVLEHPLPEDVREDIPEYTGCIGGAILKSEYLEHIRTAGFVDEDIVSAGGSGPAVSANIAAYKPI